LIKLLDAKGNTICYQYDAMRRVTAITYPSSGPDAPVTPSKTFVYDSAAYSGTVMANSKGRLAEAYTGLSATKATDEFFSYSIRGELTDAYESTPHSGTPYYHVAVHFGRNGALKSVSSNLAGLPSQAYGVDAMGRHYSVTASSVKTL